MAHAACHVMMHTICMLRCWIAWSRTWRWAAYCWPCDGFSGVRNSTHTLVKIIQPFATPELRLTSYTHPEYLAMLSAYTSASAQWGGVFLMRGTDGETVSNAKKAQKIDWFHAGTQTTLVEKQLVAEEIPALPEQTDAQTDAHSTAIWIQQALMNQSLRPKPIAEQVEQCLMVCNKLQMSLRTAIIDN